MGSHACRVATDGLFAMCCLYTRAEWEVFTVGVRLGEFDF